MTKRNQHQYSSGVRERWKKLVGINFKFRCNRVAHLGPEHAHSKSGLWTMYCHKNDIYHREGPSWTKYTKLKYRLSKVALGVSFVPVATSVPASIITRRTSVAPPQQPRQQPPASSPTLAVPKTELADILYSHHGSPSWRNNPSGHRNFCDTSILKLLPIY